MSLAEVYAEQGKAGPGGGTWRARPLEWNNFATRCQAGSGKMASGKRFEGRFRRNLGILNSRTSTFPIVTIRGDSNKGMD